MADTYVSWRLSRHVRWLMDLPRQTEMEFQVFFIWNAFVCVSPPTRIISAMHEDDSGIKYEKMRDISFLKIILSFLQCFILFWQHAASPLYPKWLVRYLFENHRTIYCLTWLQYFTESFNCLHMFKCVRGHKCVNLWSGVKLSKREWLHG